MLTTWLIAALIFLSKFIERIAGQQLNDRLAENADIPTSCQLTCKAALV